MIPIDSKTINRIAFNLLNNGPVDSCLNEKFNALISLIRCGSEEIDEIGKLEDDLSASPSYSLLYAKTTKQSFSKGEQAMAQNAWTSYRYASEILKGRFVLGESSISNLESRSTHIGAIAFRSYETMLKSRDPICALLEDSKFGPFNEKKKRKRKTK